MRIVAMAGVLVLAIFLIAKGVTALTSGFVQEKTYGNQQRGKSRDKKRISCSEAAGNERFRYSEALR